MIEKDGIYKCEICGIVVSVIEAHGSAISCCGQEAKLLGVNTKEQEGNEKHVPVVEIDGNSVKVTVGSVPHPMEEDHWIELVQIVKDGKVIAEKRLSPGQEPVAKFCCLESTDGITVRELCNKHGLWKSE